MEQKEKNRETARRRQFADSWTHFRLSTGQNRISGNIYRQWQHTFVTTPGSADIYIYIFFFISEYFRQTLIVLWLNDTHSSDSRHVPTVKGLTLNVCHVSVSVHFYMCLCVVHVFLVPCVCVCVCARKGMHMVRVRVSVCVCVHCSKLMMFFLFFFFIWRQAVKKSYSETRSVCLSTVFSIRNAAFFSTLFSPHRLTVCRVWLWGDEVGKCWNIKHSQMQIMWCLNIYPGNPLSHSPHVLLTQISFFEWQYI